MQIGYYDYEELREAATRPGAAQDDINALGEWFSSFGSMYWNGESYDMDHGKRLFPVYTITRPRSTSSLRCPMWFIANFHQAPGLVYALYMTRLQIV